MLPTIEHLKKFCIFTYILGIFQFIFIIPFYCDESFGYITRHESHTPFCAYIWISSSIVYPFFSIIFYDLLRRLQRNNQPIIRRDFRIYIIIGGILISIVCFVLAFILKVLLLGLFGTILGVILLLQLILKDEQDEQRFIQRREFRERTSQTVHPMSIYNPLEVHNKIDNSKKEIIDTCIICLEEDVEGPVSNQIYDHGQICSDCILSLMEKGLNCPLCRSAQIKI
jgi:hypothetical protein